MTKPPILGTGLTGLVGSRLVELYSNDFDFHNMDLTTGVDITNRSSIEEFISSHPSDILIHFAAFTNVSAAHEQVGNKEGSCYQVNVEGTRNIANICKDKGIYLIQISTDFVFSGKENKEYTEDDPPDPIEWYGQTKAIAEKVVQDSLSNYSIIRLTYPFRANYDLKPDIIKNILKGLKNNNLPPQFADSIITPTFVDDIAHALNVFIKKKPLGIYHVVGSSHLSPYELARKVASVFGYGESLVKKGSLEEYKETTSRPYQQYLRTSNKKIKQELGINMSSIDEALEILKSQSL